MTLFHCVKVLVFGLVLYFCLTIRSKCISSAPQNDPPATDNIPFNCSLINVTEFILSSNFDNILFVLQLLVLLVMK